jgi:gluconate 5-dehydrogenase
MDLFNLAGRRALITGSGQGVGFALAQALEQAGATVVLNGRDTAKLDRTAGELRDAAIVVELAAFDVIDQPVAAAGVARIEAKCGPIDVLVNNAGIQRRALLEEFPAGTWRELMRTNLDSVLFVAQAVARGIIARGRGKIINICSVQSELGRLSIAAYAASKGAIMYADWARYGLPGKRHRPAVFRHSDESIPGRRPGLLRRDTARTKMSSSMAT